MASAYSTWCTGCKARGGYCVAQNIDGRYVTVCRLPGPSKTTPWVYEPAPLAVQLEVGNEMTADQLRMLAGRLVTGAEAVLDPFRQASKYLMVGAVVLGALILWREFGD